MNAVAWRQSETDFVFRGLSAWCRRFSVAGLAGVAALLLSGCDVPKAQFKGMVAYKPTPVNGQIKANVGLSTSHTLTPEIEEVWRSWGNSDANIENYRQAVTEVMYEDFARCGLFSNVRSNITDEELEAWVKVETEESRADHFALKVSVSVIRPDSRELLKEYHSESDLGTSTFSENKKFKAALQSSLAQMKANLLADFKDKDLATFGQPETPAGASSLEALLLSKESSVNAARKRNRDLIAAKNETLAGLLREKKTSELSALAVRVEQVILDLNHEGEMAKDRGQRALETGSGNVERHREMAVVYKERIEILKPVLAAIKEEVANRSR